MATRAASVPVRVDAELFEAAKAAGARQHRSASQQLSHWAALGRELELASSLPHRVLDRMLAGQAGAAEVAPVAKDVASRGSFHEHVQARIASTDLAAELVAEGRTQWSESDADGNLIVHEKQQHGTWSRRVIPAEPAVADEDA